MVEKILITRFSSIGDIVLTSPVIRCIRAQLPHAEIHYLTKSAYGELLAHNPHIDKLHLLGDSFDDCMRDLKNEGFSQLIDLHNNLRSRRVAAALGVKRHGFPKLNVEKWLYVNLKWNRMPDRHIVDRYLEACAHLGVVNDGEGLEHHIGPDDSLDPTSIDGLGNAAFIALVVGAKFATKQLPESLLQAVIDRVDAPLLLLGGPEDAELGKRLASNAKGRVVNRCGQLRINQSASLLSRAGVVIAHDTGLMHLAAAYKRPIVSVWGNTVPDFGMYPYLTKEERMEVKGLSCRPCSKIGYAVCPKGHFNCMLKQDPAAIAGAAMRLLRAQN